MRAIKTEKKSNLTYLYSLPGIPRNIDPNYRLLKVGIGRPHYIIIYVLLVQTRIEPFQHELEECDKILRVWRRDVYIDVAERHRGRHGEAEAGRLASASSGS